MLSVYFAEAGPAEWILLLLLLLWCAPGAYFDDNSTLEFLKRHTSSENGVLGFMSWLQSEFPKSWTWIKAVLMWVVGGAVCFGLPAGFARFGQAQLGTYLAIAIEGGLDIWIYIAIRQNYAVNEP